MTEISTGASFTAKAVARNSAANAFRTLSAFALGFIVPPLLIRWLPEKEYAAFILCSRVAAFFILLDAGMQITVTRKCAEGLSSGDTGLVAGILHEALRIIRRLVLVGVLILVVVTTQLHSIFSEIDSTVVLRAQICLVLFAGSSLFALLLSPYNAVLVAGNQTSRLALRTVLFRVAAALAIIVAAATGSGIVVVSAISAGASFLVAAQAIPLARRSFPWLKTSPRIRNSQLARTVAKQSGLFATITLTQFLINSLDVAIVGRIDYDRIVAYSLCVTVVTGLETLHHGLMQPALPTLSAARKVLDDVDFAAAMRRWNLLVSGYWALMCFGLFVSAPVFLRLWVGQSMSDTATPVLRLLLLGYFTRYADWTYGTSVIASNYFRKIMFSPILIAFIHLTMTITIGQPFGAIGVAAGTAIAAFLGIAFTATISMRITRKLVPVQVVPYFLDSLGYPLLIAGPLGLLSLMFGEPGLMNFLALTAIALFGCTALLSVQARSYPWHAVARLRAMRAEG